MDVFASVSITQPLRSISILMSISACFMIVQPIMGIITVVMMAMIIVFVIMLLIDCGCVTMQYFILSYVLCLEI